MDKAEKLIKEKNQREEEMRLNFRLTFNSLPGQAVLYYLADKYNLFSSHIVNDPLSLAIQEGQRSVVIDILTQLSTESPEEYRKKLLKEVIGQ